VTLTETQKFTKGFAAPWNKDTGSCSHFWTDSNYFWTFSRYLIFCPEAVKPPPITLGHEETLDQIHKERKWKAAAEELKPKLKARVLKITC
jgi:hypothetical protein